MIDPVTAGGAHAPERIGRYEIRALLGAGGFAVVYQAYDSALDAMVAVKLMQGPESTPDLVRERFLAEAQLLRRVSNPNIVQVFDIGELDDGRPYFVMEYADAGVLSRRVPAQPGLADAASLRTIVEGLGSALHALHDVGVVHRDVKPANLFIAGGTSADDGITVTGGGILHDGERILVGDLGIAKDNERESVEPTILGGTPSFRAPEQMMRGADISPATDVFGASGVLWNLLTASTPPEAAALEVQLESVPLTWRGVLRRGLDPDPAQRYPTADDWVADCLSAIGETSGGTALGFRSVEGTDTCPYKGLAAFQPDDAGLFFGREVLIDELVHRLQNSPALVVGGPSGSGKSSLVRAGLLPALERGVLPGAQHWKVALFTPRTDAIGELAFELVQITGDAAITPERLRTDLTYVRRAVEAGPPVVLAIDQFEELFTLNDEQTARDVVAVLEAITESSHSTVRVVVVVRADFYDSCAHHPWLAERINENQVLVGPMGRAELRRAIEGPAHRTGLQLEPGLVDTILDDAGASAGSLPLLAHALMETWLRRRGHQLTVAGYEAAGGVAGAIAQRAEETYAKLSQSDQKRARDLVLQMTSPGENGPDTRRLLHTNDIADLEDTQAVIDTFVEARLITTSDHHIEIAHETLLRSWPRATAWIDDARDDLRTRQRVMDAAHEWELGDYDPDLLLRGTPLESTLDWADQRGRGLPPVGERFLDAGREARDERVAAADAERSRRRRNRRIAFSALAILLVAAVLQSISASRSENRANDATEAARMQVNLGLAATAEAQAPTDPLFAVALAAESAARDEHPSPDSLGALATARTALANQMDAPVPLSDGIPVGNALHIELTSDGSLLILGNRSGEVRFWDVESRQTISTNNTHTKGVESVFIHDELNLAVTGGADGQILLWDLSDQPFEPEVFDIIEDRELWSAQISPDGTLLSAVTADAGVTIYDLASGQQLGGRIESAGERDALRSVFNADGTELLVGNSKGEVIRIDIESKEPIGVLNPHATNIWDIERSADGNYIYTASNDGTLRRVDLSTMQVDEGFVTGMDGAVVEMRGIEVVANDEEVITGAANGHLQRWDARTGALIAESMAAHEDRVIGGAASADGRLYVSLGDDQKIRLWDLATRSRPTGTRVLSQSTEFFGAALGSDGTVAVGTENGTVEVIEPDGNQFTLDVGNREVFGLAVTDEGLVAAGDREGRLTLWDGPDRIAVDIRFHDNRILDIALSPDGQYLATAGSDGRIGLWSATDLDLVRSIGELGTEINGLAFTPGGDLVSADLAGRISFWDVNGGQSRSQIQWPDSLFAIAVDPTGTWIAAAGGDEAIAVVELDSGDVLQRLTPLAGGASDVAFTDGGVVAGLSRRGSVAIWNPMSGEQLGPISRVHDDNSDSWSLMIDEHLGIWSAGEDGLLHRLDVLDRTIACDISMDVFDDQRRSKFLDDQPLQSCTSETP